MIGHRQVVQARRDGLKPAAIFIDLGLSLPVVTCRFDEPEQALSLNLFPTVYVEDWEVGGPIDWRFVAGCTVHVTVPTFSDDISKAVEQIAEAGVSRLFACSLDDGMILIFSQGEWQAHANPAA